MTGDQEMWVCIIAIWAIYELCHQIIQRTKE